MILLGATITSQAPRRIAILGARGYPSTYGGFETLVRRLAPYLVGAGHKVSVYCRGSGLCTRWSAADFDGVKRIFTPGWDKKSISTLSFGGTASIDAAFRRYDSVLILNVANGFYLPLVRSGTPRVIVNVDGIEWQRQKWNGLGKAVFRCGAWCTAQFASEVICDSMAMRDLWAHRIKRTGIFIPYGADLVEYRPADRIAAIGIDPGSYGLVVSRLVPENNIDLILDAIDLLPEDVPFVVVGSANYASPLLARLVHMAARRPEFRHLGHVDDPDLLLDLWFHCGFYVHGHSVGGTNPALLQALGCGAPTVAFDTPFNREVVGESFPYLFGDSAGHLADLMLARLGHSSDASSGRAIIRDRYLWDKCCYEYERVLTGLPASQ